MTLALSQVVRRQRVLLWIAGIAMVVCVAGLVWSLRVKSPAQLAAEQSPPPASVLTAPVRNAQLTQSVTVRGTVRPPASAAIRALSTGGSSPRLVTKTPVPIGASVASGTVLLEVSGRPLFVFAGSIPAYRDLTAGLAGADVRQLQQGLTDGGWLSPRRITGIFDSPTQAAVTRFYKHAGYDPVGTGTAVVVPLSEVAFVPTLPASVATLAVTVGAIVGSDDASVLSLAVGAPEVTAIVPAGEQSGVAQGQEVKVTDDVTGTQVSGRLTSIGAYTDGQPPAGTGTSKSTQLASGQSAQAGYPVVAAIDPPLDGTWLGRDVRVQIVGAQSAGPVLVVPSAAVATETSGGTAVVVLAADGSRTVVPVRTGMVVGGDVEVTPADATMLHAGDLVVTG